MMQPESMELENFGERLSLYGEDELSRVMASVYEFAAGFSKGRVLDFGCGIGQAGAQILYPQASYFEGWDVFDKAVEFGNRHFGRHNLVYRQISSDSSQVDFSHLKDFDFIFSSNALEHVADLHFVLFQIACHMKSSGRFFCAIPHIDSSARMQMETDNFHHLSNWTARKWKTILSLLFDEVKIFLQKGTTAAEFQLIETAPQQNSDICGINICFLCESPVQNLKLIEFLNTALSLGNQEESYTRRAVVPSFQVADNIQHWIRCSTPNDRVTQPISSEGVLVGFDLLLNKGGGWLKTRLRYVLGYSRKFHFAIQLDGHEVWSTQMKYGAFRGQHRVTFNLKDAPIVLKKGSQASLVISPVSSSLVAVLGIALRPLLKGESGFEEVKYKGKAAHPDHCLALRLWLN